MSDTSAGQKPFGKTGPSLRASLFIMVLVVMFLLMPFLFWRATWFGRALTEEETGKYLQDENSPRKIQHALSQIADRIIAGSESVKQWYPRVVELRDHQSPELRATVAWVMGQDNQSDRFRQALLEMLDDPDPLVRRNAALSLVRFGNRSGKEEIRQMLQPYKVRAPASGRLNGRLDSGNPVNPGTLVARVEADSQETEIRSPLPGRVDKWIVRDGTAVRRGDPIVSLAPGEDQVWEALRALYLIGEMEDLSYVQPFAQGAKDMPPKVQQQAKLTARAIRHRAAQKAGIEVETEAVK